MKPGTEEAEGEVQAEAFHSQKAVAPLKRAIVIGDTSLLFDSFHSQKAVAPLKPTTSGGKLGIAFLSTAKRLWPH